MCKHMIRCGALRLRQYCKPVASTADEDFVIETALSPPESRRKVDSGASQRNNDPSVQGRCQSEAVIVLDVQVSSAGTKFEGSRKSPEDTLQQEIERLAQYLQASIRVSLLHQLPC